MPAASRQASKPPPAVPDPWTPPPRNPTTPNMMLITGWRPRAGSLLESRVQIENDVRNAVLAVAFLLEDDVTDQLAEAIAKIVAGKFASATSSSQAKMTLALKTMATQLAATQPAAATTSLTDIIAKLTSSPIACPGALQPMPSTTWASVVVTPADQVPNRFNPIISPQHMWLQQKMLCNARIVLIEVNSADPTAPQDCMPNGFFELHKHLNKHLAEIDKAMADMSAIDGVVSSTATTWVQGISALLRGAYLLEFDLAKSALRFQAYTSNPEWNIIKPNFGDSAHLLGKVHNLIIRFVPCRGTFDPSNPEDLSAFELEDHLQPSAITSTAWLKRVEDHSPMQTLAFLKLSCNSASVANMLLCE
ncbi:hypothetical protein E4T56_gene14208 [Termitomyces sp. T112]|nr:hypothetical protein E4T56_gene14208 [Termitomyces sp. T112]